MDIEIEREAEVALDKSYDLPHFQIIPYKNLYLAVATDIARWLVLKNAVQLDIFRSIINKVSIGCLLKQYEDDQSDVVDVLTQIEAAQIETLKPRSIFTNTRLHIHLTNKCNLRCPHCYVNSSRAYSDELSTDEVKELCDNFKGIGGTDVSLTGGEPTTRVDFLEIVDFISRLGMKVSIFSNGQCWNEEMISRLSQCNIAGVQISIDGYDEPSNSLVRGHGAFEKALETVAGLVRNHIHVKIAVTAHYETLKLNPQRFVAFSKELLEEYGRDAIEINYSYYLMPGRNIDAAWINGIKDDYFRLVNEVVSAIYPEAEEDSFVANISNSIYDSCGYGGLNVLANGDFYFCDRISDVSRNGNIRNLPFSEIHKLMMLAEEAGRVDNFMPCRGCPLKYICGGGCRAEHFRSFTQMVDVSAIDFQKIPPRECNSTTKERIYDLMIKTHKRFYR